MSELKLLSAGAVKRGVARIAQDFERDTGTRVVVEFTPVPQVRKRVGAGERVDVIVATPAAMDEFAAQSRIAPQSRGRVGRSHTGVVVHATAEPPDISTTAAFRRALEGAMAVVYNKASSGLYTQKLIDKLGLTEALADRVVVVAEGAAIMETVAAKGPGAIGIAQISEILVLIDKGCAVKLAAPLPDEIQNITTYDAAAAIGAPEAARELAASLASDAARKIFAATGIT